MKKIIVCFALAAVAALPVFAGEKSDKASTPCAEKAKAACAGKSACGKSVTKQSILSPKAAEAQKSVAKAN